VALLVNNYEERDLRPTETPYRKAKVMMMGKKNQ
jgi:hypothetical protein